MNGTAARLRPDFPGPRQPAPTGHQAGRTPAAPLWLCLWLPRLPLEVRSGACADDDARIIVDREGRVVQASEPAAEAGVAQGLSLNAALALCPGLGVLARDESAERAALARLGAWAGAFTSFVSLVPPDALVLEIRGSLRLFGGLEALRRRVCDALHATGHQCLEAVAPTPLAAAWLARAADTEAVTDPAMLASRIGRLRPAVTDWPEHTLAALRSLGVESLGDCLRLPRDGFARRLGRRPLADLDRALGRLPDPRQAFRPPPCYRGELELSAETADTTRLARAMSCLCAELEGFLRARQRAVGRLVIKLGHLRRPATELVLGLVSPALDAAHFDALFAERLERLALPAPVISITLEAEPGESFDPAIVGLFGDTTGTTAGLRLVERLRARLGRESVQGLCLQDEHRPEHAWRIAEPGSDYAGCIAPPPENSRPNWLLESPRPLECRGGRPWFDGALLVESGPERLEAGWWDGHEIARDYWVARTATGARLWIFELAAAGAVAGGAGERHWFLHGVFG
jgi:protein ImuB